MILKRLLSYALLALAPLSLPAAQWFPAEPDLARSTSFRDDFARNSLGPRYSAFGWDITAGQLHTALGGFGEAVLAQPLDGSSYEILTVVRGLDPGLGPEPGDRVCVIFGSNAERTNDYRACVYLSFGTHLALTRTSLLASGELSEVILASTPIDINATDWYRVGVVRVGATGKIGFYFGHEDEPLSLLLQATDWTYPNVGVVGVRFERESPAKTSDTFFDYLAVRAR